MTASPPHSEIAAAIGDRLKQARKGLRLTHRELARKLEVSQSYISEIEANKSKPNLDLVAGLVINFPMINSHWLLTGEGNMNNDSVAVPVRFGVDFGAFSFVWQLLDEIDESDDNKPKEVDYRLGLYLRTYINHWKALLAAGKSDEAARLLAEAACRRVAAGVSDPEPS